METGHIVTLVLGILGVGATVYGTRATRESAREATAYSASHETLNAAVAVNRQTYEALAAEQRATIESLRQELTRLNATIETQSAKIDELEETIQEQRLTIERLTLLGGRDG